MFIPKYRQKVLYCQVKAEVREIIWKLCEYKKVEIIEEAVCVDHLHICVSLPPKYSTSQFVGYLNNKKNQKKKNKEEDKKLF